MEEGEEEVVDLVKDLVNQEACKGCTMPQKWDLLPTAEGFDSAGFAESLNESQSRAMIV